MSQATIYLSDTELVANAVRKMGWSEEIALDTLNKARGKFEGEDLLVRLSHMGYFG
jgi:hypothetical protein